MTVVEVFWKPHAKPSMQKAEFALIELDMADLEEVLIALDSDRLICGRLLHTRAGEQCRVVTREVVLGFRGGAVDRVQLPIWKIVREVDE